ncbi:hypothetical protein Back11_16950 [Paenibacillus baekrokdamisoli]|uniref:Uncharacterized protein n=1 Tax=Paenibacillus baekrokdamisoli TaxID=1712516 RepID=A0A3G9INC7_9BACL|nr:hypothetical protein Back11_16950 [Paenibacillus baekrokdamisoli]
MDWYHSWIYENVINTDWFVYSIVYLICGANLLSPIIFYLVMIRKKNIRNE